MVDLPEGSPLAVALFAHRFTSTKNSVAAIRIARALTTKSLAVLRFDFTGLGKSEGDFADSTRPAACTSCSTRVATRQPFRCRNGEYECCSGAFVLLSPETAIVSLYDGSADRQPDAHACTPIPLSRTVTRTRASPSRSVLMSTYLGRSSMPANDSCRKRKSARSRPSFRFSRLCASAARIARIRSASLNGLVKRSTAPALIALTEDGTSPCPVMNTIGG